MKPEVSLVRLQAHFFLGLKSDRGSWFGSDTTYVYRSPHIFRKEFCVLGTTGNYHRISKVANLDWPRKLAIKFHSAYFPTERGPPLMGGLLKCSVSFVSSPTRTRFSVEQMAKHRISYANVPFHGLRSK